MYYLRLIGALGGLVAASVYGLAIILFRRDRSGAAADYGGMLARLTHRPLGIELEIRSEALLTDVRPCVFIANHQSALDVAILGACYRRGSVIVAKKEVGRIPFFGWIYRATGNLLIDRADTGHAVGRLKVAEDAVRARGMAVWIFPEGTRGPGNGLLLPFKKGGFRIAVGTGAPIVPVVVSPLKPSFDLARRRLGPGRVIVQLLEPIAVDGIGEGEEDLVPLMETVHARMQAALHALGVETGRLPAGGPFPTGTAYAPGRSPRRSGSG